MLNCKETTKLVSQGLDRELSLGERIGLNFHLSMCSACRNLKQQMNTLRQAAQLYTRGDIQLPEAIAVESSGPEEDDKQPGS